MYKLYTIVAVPAVPPKFSPLGLLALGLGVPRTCGTRISCPPGLLELG